MSLPRVLIPTALTAVLAASALALAATPLPTSSASTAPAMRPTHAPLPPRPPAVAAPMTQPVSLEVMTKVYEEVKTPYKYGVVLPREDDLVDCPSVYRFNNHWYMTYATAKDKVGYETKLAESDDLLHWKKLGAILPLRKEGWDAWQADAGMCLVDTTWGGSMAPEKYDGKYWASYIGGAKKGYETDPLSTGLAWTTAPDKAEPWNRYEGNPILSASDKDSRFWERTTIFKTSIIRDPKEQLGFPFLMYYNARSMDAAAASTGWTSGKEVMGMAASKDMVHWQRIGGDQPLVADPPGRGTGISGDPQLVQMTVDGKELWVMFYFGFRWEAPGAFDTFAASYDLLHWTKWRGEHLVEISPMKPAFDDTFAHKPWMVKHDGVVYHFYCSVGAGGRQIALATSKDMGKSSLVIPVATTPAPRPATAPATQSTAPIK